MTGIGKIRESYTPEMALVVLICRVYFNKASSDELRGYVQTYTIDWRLFERIITAHQVRPFIYKVLSAHSSGIDTGLIERLKKICFRIAAGNLQKLEELVRLNKLFSAHGVDNVPYKGVILSQILLDDYISRETADIDFLIGPQHFSKAYEILIRDGYAPRYYNPDFERQFLHTSHELLFTKTIASGDLKIEIHWSVTNRMMHIPMPNNDVMQNLETIKLPGGDARIFNIQNHLLVLLVHHGVNDIWRTLRHSLDVSLFLEKYRDAIDWEAFRDATRKYKIRHTTESGFSISAQLFGTELPEIYRHTTAPPEKLMQHLLHFPAIRKLKLNIESFSQQIFLRDSFIDKIQLIVSYVHTAVTPNIRDMEAYPVSKRWYVLYYLIRPYRILLRRRRK